MAEHYVTKTGNDTTGDGTTGNPLATISSGITLLSAGDTLWIGDGTYSGITNRIANTTSGSGTDNYTYIKAINDWGVTLNNTGEAYQPGIEIDGVSFVHVQGFHVTGDNGVGECSVGGAGGSDPSDHIKIIRCSGDGSGEGNGSSFNATSGSTYVLFEECYSYGGNRYAMRTGKEAAQYVIFRRCVVRWDYQKHTEVYAAFSNYECSNVYFQNCIAIDGLDIREAAYTYDGLKAFFTPNGADETHLNGCIVLNFEGAGIWFEDSPVTDNSVTDCVVWDIKASTLTQSYAPYSIRSRTGDGPVDYTRLTIGENDTGLGSRLQTTSTTLKDSIIYNQTLNDNFYSLYSGSAGYGDFGTHDYNNFYGNTGDRNISTGIGANSITTDPKTTGLTYINRIDDGSTLKTAGTAGGQLGAEIVFAYGRSSGVNGVSGLLYGEDGWDELQDGNGSSNTQTLFPFPNEDVMRTEMKAFYKAANDLWDGSPELSGDRGFCADGQTLTYYISNYLGGGGLPEPPLTINQTDIPDGIVNESYSKVITASGGDSSSAYTFTVASGITATGLGLATDGTYSGTPSIAQTANFTVLCTDASAATDNQAFSQTISTSNTLSITTTTIANGSVNVLYSVPIYATGGSQNYSFTVASGVTATGLGLATDGIYSGTPTTLQTSNFTVLCTDAGGLTDNQALSNIITASSETSPFTTRIEYSFATVKSYVNNTLITTSDGGGI